MSEQDIEIPAEHIEHAEHAAHEMAHGDRLTRDVAVAVSVMAIIAATIASFQDTESAKAMGLKNEAVLLQSQASDQWGFFQAKSIKKNNYLIAAEEAAAAGRDASAFTTKAHANETDEAQIQTEAKRLEQESRGRWEESAHHTHRQHTLTLGVTLVHIGIAISSLAIFMHRRMALNAALALCGGGILVAIWAFLGTGG